MRVISGSARGLKLNAPKNNDVRPTTDRIKESLFNIISTKVYNSVVLDLFAGSGALGIECLSRGAKEAYFCDNNKESIKVLTSNLEKTRFIDKSNIIKGDYKEAISKLGHKKMRFDLIFVDPPYYEGYFEDVLNKIQKFELLKNDGVIVVEHDAKDVLKDFGDYYIIREKKYGITILTFYGLEDDDE